MNKSISTTIAASALVALAGSAMGAKNTDAPLFQNLNGQTTPTPTQAGQTLQVDISGIRSIAGLGSGLNDVINLPIPAGSQITGIGWSTNQTSFGASWLSEMRIAFLDDVNFTSTILLAPLVSITTPGTSVSSSSGGVIKFADIPLGNIPVGAGGLNIEFFESFDDDDPFNGFGSNTDGIYNSGSTLTIQYVIPSPASAGLLGLAGIAALGRKRRA